MDIGEITYRMVMYFNCMFEIFLLYIFLEALFPVYEDRRNIRVLKMGTCATTIFIVNLLEIPLVNTFCIPIICIVYVKTVFRVEFKLNLLYNIFFYMILAVTEFVFHFIYGALEIDTSTADFNRMYVLIIEKLFEFAIIQAVRKSSFCSPKADSYSSLRCLFTLPVSAMILLNGFLLRDSYSYGYLMICIGGILLILSNIVNFSMTEKLLLAENAAKDNEMLKLKTALEHNHYRRMEEINQEYAEYVHEMKHIVRTIEHFADEENAGRFQELATEASRLLLKKSPLDKKLYINDPVSNAVFMEREKAAQELGVRYEVDVQPGTDVNFVDETDKIRMFGNLLDNALEAAAGCENGYVSVSLYRGNDAIVIFRVVNNFRNQSRKRENRYLTTKADQSRHGFGLKNVEELSHKYNGILNIEDEKDRFTVILMLSNMQKKEKN